MIKARINFALTSWDDFIPYVKGAIFDAKSQKICDVGAGRDPILDYEFISRNNVDYHLLDCSQEELNKRESRYGNEIIGDIGSPDFQASNRFDLVISRMTAEHIKNGALFHKNIFRLLVPGGIAIHFFPTLFATPFLVNKTLPSKLASFLVSRMRDAPYFPAYYSWCFGPTKRQISRLEECGYEVLEYTGFFGHGYFEKLPILRTLHFGFSRFLAEHFPIPHLTSYARVKLRKVQL